MKEASTEPSVSNLDILSPEALIAYPEANAEIELLMGNKTVSHEYLLISAIGRGKPAAMRYLIEHGVQLNTELISPNYTLPIREVSEWLIAKEDKALLNNFLLPLLTVSSQEESDLLLTTLIPTPKAGDFQWFSHKLNAALLANNYVAFKRLLHYANAQNLPNFSLILKGIFQKAIEANNISLVKACLAQGAASLLNKLSPLEYAVCLGKSHATLVSFLYEQGINLPNKAWQKELLLSVAAFHGDIETLKFLLNKSISLTSESLKALSSLDINQADKAEFTVAANIITATLPHFPLGSTPFTAAAIND
ncbi:MAG: hypothetical protein ACK4M7_07430, partial [Burkholderiales bacterium]